MAKLNLRGVGALALCTGWAYACGGSQFSASGGAGTAGISGTSAAGGSSTAGGDASGGSPTAGTDSGGSPGTGGLGEAGAAQGGSSTGGTSVDSGGAMSGGGGGSAGVGGGASGAGGVVGAGGVRNSGDCLVDKDCASGACVAVYPLGFRTCAVSTAPPTCSAADACCPGVKECAAGSRCTETPLGPSCGGALVRPTIECAKDGCTAAADCTGNNAICVPAGALGRKMNTCITGGCRRDEDCKDAAGGKCEPVTTYCCNAPTGLYCVYPGKGCRTSAECAAGSTCQIIGQKTGECTAGGETCAG